MRLVTILALGLSVSGCALLAPGQPNMCEAARVPGSLSCQNGDNSPPAAAPAAAAPAPPAAPEPAPEPAPVAPEPPAPEPPKPDPKPDPEPPGKPDKPDRPDKPGHGHGDKNHGHDGPKGRD
jgi:hypothetical protein